MSIEKCLFNIQFNVSITVLKCVFASRVCFSVVSSIVLQATHLDKLHVILGLIYCTDQLTNEDLMQSSHKVYEVAIWRIEYTWLKSCLHWLTSNKCVG